MLLLWAAISVAVFVNAVIGGLLPKFEGCVLILHVLGFFAILLPLIVYGPHQPASEVFGNFMNTGDWPTQGLSFMIGLVGNVFAFGGTCFLQVLWCTVYGEDSLTAQLGADGAIHVCSVLDITCQCT